MRKAAREASWLRLHRLFEQQMSVVVQGQFRRHGQRVARNIDQGMALQYSVDELSVPAETEKLLEALEPLLARAMLVGAASMRDFLALEKTLGNFDLSQFAIELPSRVVAGIRQALKELTGMSYWQSVAQWSKKHITAVIEQGIRRGDSNQQIAQQVRAASKGVITRKRAIVISRSETTGALNAGHHETLLELREHDAGARVLYLAVLDDRTRASHAALHGTSISVGEEFSFGGEKAPYPGHASLSPQNRVNCRCTIVGDFGLVD